MKITIHIKEKLNSVINYMSVQGYSWYVRFESFGCIYKNVLRTIVSKKLEIMFDYKNMNHNFIINTHYSQIHAKFNFMISELHVEIPSLVKSIKRRKRIFCGLNVYP